MSKPYMKLKCPDGKTRQEGKNKNSNVGKLHGETNKMHVLGCAHVGTLCGTGARPYNCDISAQPQRKKQVRDQEELIARSTRGGCLSSFLRVGRMEEAGGAVRGEVIRRSAQTSHFHRILPSLKKTTL